MKKNNKKRSRTDVIETTALRSSILSKTVLGTIALLIAVVTLAAYLPALRNGFVNWDDDVYVYENLNMQSFDLSFLKWASTTIVAGLWHPMTLLSLATDHAIWGLNPLGYHLTNIIIHSLNTFLVFMLVVQLIKYGNVWNDHKKALLSALTTSLLFGIHPVHVESVAWISERKDVLSAFFFLLTLLTYVKYVSSQGSKKSIFYVLSILSYLFALMSKPMAVSLPVVLLILDYCPLKRLTIAEIKNAKPIIGEKIPFFILSFLTTLITIWAHHSSKALPTLERYSLMERLLTATHSYIFYLIKMIIPLSLAPFYPYPSEADFITLEYLGFFILFLIITISAIVFLKNRNSLFPAIWFYYLLTLIPVIGIIQVGGQAAADRYTYLPSIGIFLLIGLMAGVLFAKYQKKMSRLMVIFSILVASTIMISMTIRQISVWQDSLSLWTYEVKLYPGSALAHNYLGLTYYELGRLDEAEHRLLTALKLDPNNVMNHSNLGNIYFKQGILDKAEQEYKTVLRLSPDEVHAHNNLGSAYYKQERFDEAIREYHTVLRLKPDHPNAHFNLGLLYRDIGRPDEAIHELATTLSLNPNNSEARFYLGQIYTDQGRFDKAIEEYQALLRNAYDNPEAHNALGILYAKLGRISEALQELQIALGLKSDEAIYHNDLGNAYLQLGRLDDAIQKYTDALRLDPDYVEAHYNLGIAYWKKGITNKAKKEFETTINLNPNFQPARQALIQISK